MNEKREGAGLIDVNGERVAPDAPAVGVLDRGFLYGDGLFETVRAYNGVPFRLPEHLARLRASAAELRIASGLDTDTIAERVTALVRECASEEAYVRITVTRGRFDGNLALGPAARPTVAIIVRPLHTLPPELYERGVDAVTASVRQNAESPVPRHKTLNYLERLLARTEAREQGAYEALLLNTRGEVAEGATTNLFLVHGGIVTTPRLGANILPGVTRQEVMALAREAGYELRQRRVSPEELRRADEVFLTNSIAELLPVCALDGAPVGAGTPGEITRDLHVAYLREVRREVERHAVAGGHLP
jgi:branched-chain amino acid aminotransferase